MNECCKSKDSEIDFLRKMVQDLLVKQASYVSELLTPYKPSNQVFNPVYIDDKGELVKEDMEEKEVIAKILNH